MKRKKMMWIFVCFTLSLFTATVWAAPVPDTGQNKCYDATVEITCPSPGQAFYGQDAQYSINPMSYTKLDGSGNALPDSATSWVMVKDNVTGLIWEMKGSKDGVQNYDDPHDADNNYRWYNSNPANNNDYPGHPGNGTDNTEAFLKALNSAHYGGYSDWRLPTINELSFIVHYNIPYPEPTVDTRYFPNTQASLYWSSTNSVNYTYFAYFVSFSYGYSYDDNKYNFGYVRAVRGGQSQSTYVDNVNGTVTDTSTGLMWQQQATLTKETWEQALAYCEGLNLGGYTDWRLPTINEIRSLADYGRYNPAINVTYFPDTFSSFYWSSTTLPVKTSIAWGINFSYARDDYKSKYDFGHVRAVRGGLAPTPPAPDIKANGQDGRITVSTGTPVLITASLAPGDQNGKLADWWLVENSPLGIYSFTSSGWSPGISVLFQYPLVSMSPVVNIYNVSLPAGDYAYYFGVDMSPNGILDSPLYYDVIEVNVVD